MTCGDVYLKFEAKVKFKFLQNYALGCLTGALIALFLAWSLDETVSVVLQKTWIYLVSAGVTLIAASLALLGTLSVIENQNRLASEEVERSLLAARAVLPPVLSSLSVKASRGFNAIADYENLLSQDKEIGEQILQNIRITKDEIDTLKECIQVSDPNTARWLSLVVSHFQIHTSRLENDFLREYRFQRSDLHTAKAAMNWVLIRQLIGHLFDFGRAGQLPSKTLNKEMISYPIDSAFSGPVFENWDEAYDQLVARIDSSGGWSSEAFLARIVKR